MKQEELLKQWIRACIKESLQECLNDYNHYTQFLETKINTLQKTPQPNRWLFTSDVARILNVSTRTVKRLRQTKAIPYAKIGKTCYYPSLYFEKIVLDQIKAEFNELFDE